MGPSETWWSRLTQAQRDRLDELAPPEVRSQLPSYVPAARIIGPWEDGSISVDGAGFVGTITADGEMIGDA